MFSSNFSQTSSNHNIKLLGSIGQQVEQIRTNFTRRCIHRINDNTSVCMYIEQHLTIVRQEKKGDYTPNSTDMKRWWQRNRIVWTKTRDHFYVIRDKNAHAQIKMFSSSSRVSFAECHENEGFIFRRNFYMQHCRRPAHIRCIKHIHTSTFFSSQVCVCLWVCLCVLFSLRLLF